MTTISLPSATTVTSACQACDYCVQCSHGLTGTIVRVDTGVLGVLGNQWGGGRGVSSE